MSPVICFIDEIEKALAGAQGGGASDSGVSSRLFGSLLSWLSDHTSQAFVIATCNDISRLPPEFARAERFDAVFFLDLPGSSQRQRIWELYLQHYQLPPQELPPSGDWTGAEIKSCCRLAAMLGVSLKQAAANVVPVAATGAESVQRLREWAGGRCLDASRGGLYLPTAPSGATNQRRVDRRASRN
jgi:SpoVK/Ycf46/Vps4 family AAA+-type ATPase